jgi:hypothetical protein
MVDAQIIIFSEYIPLDRGPFLAELRSSAPTFQRLLWRKLTLKFV